MIFLKNDPLKDDHLKDDFFWGMIFWGMIFWRMVFWRMIFWGMIYWKMISPDQKTEPPGAKEALVTLSEALPWQKTTFQLVVPVLSQKNSKIMLISINICNYCWWIIMFQSLINAATAIRYTAHWHHQHKCCHHHFLLLVGIITHHVQFHYFSSHLSCPG